MKATVKVKAKAKIVMKAIAKAVKPKKPQGYIPTLEECEEVLGDRAFAWAGRCFEIASRIVDAGLVPGGVAVYGHWTGSIHPRSIFYDRRHLGFVPHGWILRDDGTVIDPTRWAFEGKRPYLFQGVEPDGFTIDPCMHCEMIDVEHNDAHEEACGNYEPAPWPYDEGGNEWREAIQGSRPLPKGDGPKKPFKLSGAAAIMVSSLFKFDKIELPTDVMLTFEHVFYLANMSYRTLLKNCGPDGLKQIYEGIADFEENAIAFIPWDNAERARREVGFDRT